MNLHSNSAIMGRTEKLFEQPSAPSNELDWSSPVPDKDSTTTRLIPLTQGQFAIVDAADFEWLNQWKWTANWNQHASRFYATRWQGTRKAKKLIQMHRLLMGCDIGDGIKIDHANRDSLDNTRKNLRKCTDQQNQGNTAKAQGCSSVFKGVSKMKSGKWRASIRLLDGKTKHLGVFLVEAEAAKAYDAAAIEKYGEFALINFAAIRSME